MTKSFYVDCPFCEGLMEVDAESGKVLQKWGADERAHKGSDKLANALQKISDDKKKRVDLFEKKKDEMEENRSKMQDLFKKEVKKVKKKGVDKDPIRPFDLD